MRLTEIYKILKRINDKEHVREYDMLRKKKIKDATKDPKHKEEVA